MNRASGRREIGVADAGCRMNGVAHSPMGSRRWAYNDDSCFSEPLGHFGPASHQSLLVGCMSRDSSAPPRRALTAVARAPFRSPRVCGERWPASRRDAQIAPLVDADDVAPIVAIVTAAVVTRWSFGKSNRIWITKDGSCTASKEFAAFGSRIIIPRRALSRGCTARNAPWDHRHPQMEVAAGRLSGG